MDIFQRERSNHGLSVVSTKIDNLQQASLFIYQAVDYFRAAGSICDKRTLKGPDIIQQIDKDILEVFIALRIIQGANLPRQINILFSLHRRHRVTGSLVSKGALRRTIGSIADQRQKPLGIFQGNSIGNFVQVNPVPQGK